MIPIENIYFLLCYAWDTLEEREIVNTESIDFKDHAHLFGSLLANGCNYLLKRGLDRCYIVHQESIPGIKGKLLVNPTINQNLLIQKKTFCEYDELDYNVLHNQIIKTTIARLLTLRDLDYSLKNNLNDIYIRFQGIDLIDIKSDHFSRLRFHRNNSFYRFLCEICKLIYERLSVSETEGSYQFIDFERDEVKMNKLFEKFILNFYRRELIDVKVAKPYIKWDVPDDQLGLDYLPTMRTDIVLDYSDRIVVIDTKYYKDALKTHYNKSSLISSNLYQIFTYVQNYCVVTSKRVEGMLLYPVVNYELDLNYTIRNNNISIKTINLNQSWERIYGDLINLITF